MPTKADFRGLCIGLVAILSRRTDATVFEGYGRPPLTHPRGDAADGGMDVTVEATTIFTEERDAFTSEWFDPLASPSPPGMASVIESEDWDDLLRRAPRKSLTPQWEASLRHGRSTPPPGPGRPRRSWFRVKLPPLNGTQPPVRGRPFWSTPPHPLHCGSFDLRPVWPSRPLEAWRLDRTDFWQRTRPT